MFLRIIFFIFLLLPGKLLASQTISEGALIRDAEIEETLKSYIAPIFEAAGLNPNTLHLHIVRSKEVNAFGSLRRYAPYDDDLWLV